MWVAMTVALLVGCAPSGRTGVGPAVDGEPHLALIDLSDPLEVATLDGGPRLAAAKNEWAHFSLRVHRVPMDPDAPPLLRVSSLAGPDGKVIGANVMKAYQVASMPVDANQAGYVRHTGAAITRADQPRAMLPAAMDKGLVNLSKLRDPRRPTDPAGHPDGAEDLELWIEWRVPVGTPAGDYRGTLELTLGPADRALATMDLSLTVYDFVMPDERHLHMVAALDWENLARLYPRRFEAITPRLVNRADPRYAEAVRTLDELISLAEANRAEVIVPRLQPTVKWPGGRAPEFDWGDFDSLVTPWLGGSAFADGTPLGFWPLPAIDHLENYDFDRRSMVDYWSAVATHFDSRDWLGGSPVWLEGDRPGQATGADALSLSARARLVLESHPRIGVMVPMQEDQVRFNADGNPALPDPAMGARMTVAAPGLVFPPPARNWPDRVARPDRWLPTDAPGLAPYAAVGATERDVRLWAWLASLRQAGLIVWNSPLPRTDGPGVPAGPSDLTWFYPGDWFALDEPVATLQLKWLRRAQQDFEYLQLARQRGQVVNAIMMARLVAKPVEIQPGQNPDPVYALFCGTSDRQAWEEARRLLARSILLRDPGSTPDAAAEHALNLDMLRWMQPRERPIALGRSTLFGPTADRAAAPGALDARLGIDIYNASDSRPDDNSLEWTDIPHGWHVRPQPVGIPALATYNVRRFSLDARVDPTEVDSARHGPIGITFTNGFTGVKTPIAMVIPVAASARREGNLALDGSLGEWTVADAIQDGPLVEMVNRPALQRGQLQYADTPTGLYSAWGEKDFYLAFKVAGVTTTDVRRARNFVEYQFRRAWGEDLTEALLQAVYPDNTVGPLLHLVVKPGGLWVERRLDERLNAEPWQTVAGADVRYAGTVDEGIWRGELAIPWDVLTEGRRGRPSLLRFNFAQHRQATGQSASWAGPVDFGRDDAFMGLLVLREADGPGAR